MRYQIILRGNDLKKDVEAFVADVEDGGIVNSLDNEEGIVIEVDSIELVLDP